MCEKLVLCPARAHRLFYYCKGAERDGSAHGDGQRELKGHVIAFPAPSPAAWAELRFPCSPAELPQMLSVVLLAPPQPGQTQQQQVATSLSACRQLHVSPARLVAWARHLAPVFKELGVQLGVPIAVDDGALQQYEVAADGVPRCLLETAVVAASEAEAEAGMHHLAGDRGGPAQTKYGERPAVNMCSGRGGRCKLAFCQRAHWLSRLT